MKERLLADHKSNEPTIDLKALRKAEQVRKAYEDVAAKANKNEKRAQLLRLIEATKQDLNKKLEEHISKHGIESFMVVLRVPNAVHASVDGKAIEDPNNFQVIRRMKVERTAPEFADFLSWAERQGLEVFIDYTGTGNGFDFTILVRVKKGGGE